MAKTEQMTLKMNEENKLPGYRSRSSVCETHAKYLISVNSSGHGPCGDDIVHDPLTEALGNLVELQEVSHAVQHLVVAVGVGIHLLEDGGYITKDGGIEES